MKISLNDIQPFIFNWNGKFDKTCIIEDSLKSIFDNIVVINSDDDNTRKGWINIGNESYFSDQFRKALELFPSDKKVFFHIQGDTNYDKWVELVNDSIEYYEKYEWGIYTPDVTNIWFTSENSDIYGAKSEDENIRLIGNSDETVWFIHSDIIDKFYERDLLKVFDSNKFGWGWDVVFASLCFLNQRTVIRDYNHKIEHELGTNYNKEQAANEMVRLYSLLDDDIKECVSYIQGDRQQLLRYL